jgi:hypothetical protein
MSVAIKDCPNRSLSCRASAARCQPSGEQIGAGGGELHVGSALRQFQPAAGDSEIQASAVFRGRALVAEQERAVELFDIDAAILNRFESRRMLHQPARGFLGIVERAVLLAVRGLADFAC